MGKIHFLAPGGICRNIEVNELGLWSERGEAINVLCVTLGVIALVASINYRSLAYAVGVIVFDI